MDKVTVDAYHLVLPLKQPYRLSFGTLYNFDSYLVRIEHKGGEFWGECTALPGYSWEIQESIWARLKGWLAFSGDSLESLAGMVMKEQAGNPFAATPLLTAIEKALHPQDSFEIDIPVVGVLITGEPSNIETEIFHLLEAGYTTIKIKASGRVDADKEIISAAQRAARGRALLRIDANQGYTVADFEVLMAQINPEGIELFEQPFKPEAWKEMERVAPTIPVPLMLDEAIWTEDDIFRAAQLNCAKYVKLKLVKHSSPQRTINSIKAARAVGLNVILGNGVQTDIGCYDEIMIYAQEGLTTAAECNGFLKQTMTLFRKPMVHVEGRIRVAGHPEIDMNVLDEFCHEEFRTAF